MRLVGWYLCTEPSDESMSEKMVFFLLGTIRSACPAFINIFPRKTIDKGGRIDRSRTVAYVKSLIENLLLIRNAFLKVQQVDHDSVPLIMLQVLVGPCASSSEISSEKAEVR